MQDVCKCRFLAAHLTDSVDSPTRTLAAGLSTYRDLRMVAPSLVTIMSFVRPILCRILSWQEQHITSNILGLSLHCHGFWLSLVLQNLLNCWLTYHALGPKSGLDKVSYCHCANKRSLRQAEEASGGVMHLIVPSFLINLRFGVMSQFDHSQGCIAIAQEHNKRQLHAWSLRDGQSLLFVLRRPGPKPRWFLAPAYQQAEVSARRRKTSL